MNLTSVIDGRLWVAVQSSYESGNYAGAITDSIFYLSELLRNKSGLDSDGAQLAGSALGGESPIIKVNPFHTESDRNEQRGVEQLVRGLYTGIRNPRSHEKRTDTQETADVVIAFVGWVAGLIDKSKSPFDTAQIVSSVFDEHFALSARYAELLVARIPIRKRLEIAIEVFQRRGESSKIQSVSYFLNAVLAGATQEEQEQFWLVVSECLENANQDEHFRTVIQAVGKDWIKISELARLRAEHRLIESIKRGRMNKGATRCADGSLGTWASGITKHFISVDELATALTLKLFSDSSEERRYLYVYFFATLRKLRPDIGPAVRHTIVSLLEAKDEDTYAAVSWMKSDWAGNDKDDKWVAALRDAVIAYAPQPTEMIEDDDIPF